MKLPKISYEPEKVQRETVAMGGLNWSDALRDGDLRHSLNLSLRRWPYLTTRKERTKQTAYSAVTALTAHGKLVAVRGTDLLLDGVKVGTVRLGEKRFAVVNTKLVIWPDMVYLDLEDNRVKPLGAKVTLSPQSVTFTDHSLSADTRPLILPDGDRNHGATETPTWWWQHWSWDKFKDYPVIRTFDSVSRTAGGWVRDNFREATVGGNVGKFFELSQAMEPNFRWGSDGYATPHPTRYGKLMSSEISGYSATYWYEVYECPIDNGNLLDHFKAGDAVTITGAGENDKEAAVIKAVTATELTFTSDFFKKEGMVDTAVNIERKVPPLEFICESQNRLWGCEGHTIWASALGDPSNFYVNKGLSTDSYSVAVGTDGAFTGCVGYSEGVLFWKEDCLHKVLGTYPASYEAHTYGVPGVKAGCDKSQVIVNNVLYYLGQRGVYAYTGGTPQLISDCFGEKRLTQGVGGSDGEKYYLAAKEGNTRHLLAYDPGKGLWLREDDTGVRDFARLGNELYFADEGGNVWLIDGGGEDPEQEWTAQFTPFYETAKGRKRYSRLLLRLELPKGSWLKAELRLDGGPWTECGKAVGRTNDVVPMRLGVNRCDKFELRLSGKGPCTVLSILREFTVGSEK